MSSASGKKKVRVRKAADSAAAPAAAAPSAAPPRIVVHLSTPGENATTTKYLWRVKADEWPPTSLAAFVGVIAERFCGGAAPTGMFIRDDELNDEFALSDLDHLLEVAAKASANVVNVRCTATTTAAAVSVSPVAAAAGAAAPALSGGAAAADMPIAAFGIDRRNELVVARDDTDPEAAATGEMKLALNGPNFRRMRAAASAVAPKPVVCFVGPTAVGKSALIGTVTESHDKPVVALPGQVIPTTSNVNAFQCTLRPVPDETFAHVARLVESQQPQTRLRRTESTGSASDSASKAAAARSRHASSGGSGGEEETSDSLHSTTFESSQTHSQFRVPHLLAVDLVQPLPVCLLDVEGDDGGLPLLEYAKAHDFNTGDAQEALNNGDIAEFVQSLLEQVSRDELNAYMERRKFVTRVLLPKLIYVVADVIVFVNTVPAHRESAYLERVLEFCEQSQKGVNSAERPSLILVHNMAAAGPWSVDQSTRSFLSLVDRKSQLSRSYRSIDVIKIPHWRDAELYAMQLNRLHLLMAQRTREQQALKRRLGLLVPERTWFDLLDLCLEDFHSQAQLSMSRIFSRLIVSNAALANSAFKFFDALYSRAAGAGTVVQYFASIRHLSICMLAHLFLLRLLERGVGSTVELHGALEEQLQPLLARIDARAPCAYRDAKGNACTGEQSTHGDMHRLPGNKKSRGTYKQPPRPFIMADDETRQVLLTVLNDNESLLEAAVGGDAMAAERLHRRRAALLHQGAREWNRAGLPATRDLYLQLGCVACLDQVADVALTCGHGSLCRRCSDVVPLRTAAVAAAGSAAATAIPSIGGKARAAAAADNAPRKFACALCTADSAQQQILIECLRPLGDPGINAYCAADVGGVSNEVCMPAPLPGTQGLRVLVLDGGGSRLAVQLGLLERLESATGMQLSNMFDMIGGVGHGGLLALLLAIKQLSLARCRAILQRLESEVLDKSKSFMAVRSFLARAPFAATKLNALLADVIGSATPLLQPPPGAAVGEEQHPKAFVLVGESKSSLDACVFANYAAGRRVQLPRSSAGEQSPAQIGVPSDPQLEALLPLWHMARASVATPGWFKAAQIEGSARNAVFVDGSVVCASPALHALTECDVLYRGAANVDLLVALGVGLADQATPGSASPTSLSGSRKSAGDQLLSVVAARSSLPPRDLALEAAAVDAEVRRRQAIVPTALRAYVRIDPKLPVAARQADTRSAAARTSVVGAAVDWLKSTEATAALARLRASVIAASFFVDGAGADRLPKRAGDKQVFVVTLRRRAQQPAVPLRFYVASEPRDAFKSIKVKETRLGTTVSYTLAAPPSGRASDVVRVAVFVAVGGSGVLGDDAKAIEAASIDETAARDPEVLAHVAGSPFFVRRLSDAPQSTIPVPHVWDIVDFARQQPPLHADVGVLSEVMAPPSRLLERMVAFKLEWHNNDPGTDVFGAIAVHIGAGGDSVATALDARRIAARWLANNADYRTEDGRALHQRLDTTHDTWTDLIERVSGRDGTQYCGDWLCALAISEALGAPLLIVSGGEDDHFVCLHWPQSRLQRSDERVIALAKWSGNLWHALKSPPPAVLDGLMSNA